MVYVCMHKKMPMDPMAMPRDVMYILYVRRKMPMDPMAMPRDPMCVY